MSSPRFGIAAFQFEPLPDMLKLAREIEDLGYANVWVGDSQMIWREAFVTLGAMGAVTSRVLLGTGVTNVVTRHVAVQASAWSSLAELTGGRAILGVGLGDSALETLGLRPSKMKDLEQAIGSIRALIRGETIDLDGAQVRLTHAYGKEVPVYIAASGPKMIELSGRIADGVILLVGTHPPLVQAALDRLAVGARSAGREPADIDTVVWVPFSIDRDGAKARDHVRPHVARAVLHPMPFDFPPEDQAVIDEIRKRYDYYSHLAQGAPQGEVVPDRLVERFAIAGNPEECLEQVRRLQAVGIGQIALIPHGPDRLGQVRLFAREVMARL